ncbi:hypothetical protein [Pelagibacterium lacus]|nr:hypothetical protein [Pelagibacterium lacus]
MTTRPPEPPRIAPRSKSESEMRALLDEIPSWPDAMLLHMHKRFATSRLFRVHHDPHGPLTERAVLLRDAAGTEIALRGLSPLAETGDGE